MLEFKERLIRERARTRDDAYVLAAFRWRLCNLARGDADVALTGADDSRTVWAEQTSVGVIALQRGIYPRFILRGHTLSDAHDELHACGSSLKDRRGRRLGWHRDERCICTGRSDRLSNAVEHGNAFDVLTALAGGDTSDHLRAIGAVSQPVELPLAAGEALHDHFGVFVDEDRHVSYRSFRSQLQRRCAQPRASSTW